MQRITVSPEQIFFPQIVLNPDQRHYLCRVLRLQPQDRFLVLNGMGKLWLAELGMDNGTIIEELTTTSGELPQEVTLIAALPKGNGFDDVVRACTELGVTRIQPVISDRTLLQPSAQKLSRWSKIAAEAAEQCERLCVPVIVDPVSFLGLIEQVNNADSDRLICLARGNHPHLVQWLRHKVIDKPLMVAIGPEGGWSDREIVQAQAANFIPVSLGDRVLRAITAPIVALSLISSEIMSRE